MKRREFLKETAAAAAMLSYFPASLAGVEREIPKDGIEQRALGKTGQKLSVIGFASFLRVSGEQQFEGGSYYNGDLTTFEARLTLRPWALLNLDLTVERNDGTATDTTGATVGYLEQLYGIRVLLNFSPNLQFSSLTQYDTESREIGANNKLRWTFNAYGDLFVVYNHNGIRSEDSTWLFESNQLPIKVQYHVAVLRRHSAMKSMLAVTAAAAATIAAGAGAAAQAPAGAGAGQAPADVVVHASALPRGALSEFQFWNDPASPGGRLVGTPNDGGNLDPPPESDPHVRFTVRVVAGVPYRCWIRMKVGQPKGQALANRLWVQFSAAVDAGGQPTLRPGTGSYLTAQGPTQQGWTWVGCNAGSAPALVRFAADGDVTVRIQAGMEGVGFDQLVLSPARFLNEPPSVAVVQPQE